MLRIKLHDELPPGCFPVVVGDLVLGGWDHSKAVPLRQQPESRGVWRLSFFLPASLSSFEFQYGLLDSSGQLRLETGGKRCVSAGDQLARSDEDGGPAVQLPVASGAIIRGFPGFTSNQEGLFDAAEHYFNATAARGGYWQGVVTPSPRLIPRPSPLGVVPSIHIGDAAARSAKVEAGPRATDVSTADGGAETAQPSSKGMLRAVASFQDLVLVAGAGSDAVGLVSPGGAGYDDLSVSPAGSSSPGGAEVTETPVPDAATPSRPTALQAVQDDDVLLPVDVPTVLQRVNTGLREATAGGLVDVPAQTPDAAAAAAAAATANTNSVFGLGRPGDRVARTKPRSSRHPSPPRHLEMASSVPDGVLDASAVNFVHTPRQSAGSGALGGAADATDRRRLAIVLVGLPARGKSFTAHKLARYLTWLGFPTKHFNVGKYRRDFVGSKCDRDFFDPANQQAVGSRNAVARLAMEDMLGWMERGGHCGIFDATNSTPERRAMILDLAAGRCKVIFLEVVCTDEALIRRNVLEKVTSSPDYAGTDAQAAMADFLGRMDEYAKVYVPLADAQRAPAEATSSFIRVVDMASGAASMQVNRIQGYLAGRVVYFLLNTQLAFRPVFLCRHGQSEDNQAGRIGGDSPLSPAGRDFAMQLRRFIDGLPQEQRPSAVWTSTLRRTVQTARPLAALPQVQWRALDEIDAGKCEGLTYDQVQASMPDEFGARQQDKLRYRYPRGESYLDVIQRLEPAIIEIERQRNPVLIVAHQAVLRCLYGYFTSRAVEEVPHLPMPLHTVIQLTPSSYGVQEQWHQLVPSEPGHA